MMPTNNPRATASELRTQAEAALRAKSAAQPDDLEAMSPHATRAMLHELQVHQIELELQNEELRRTEAALDDSLANYFDLYDLAPVGYQDLAEHRVSSAWASRNCIALTAR